MINFKKLKEDLRTELEEEIFNNIKDKVINDDLKKELIEEVTKEVLENNDNSKHTDTQEVMCLKGELKKHKNNFNNVKINLNNSGIDSQIEGYISEVHKNFITIINEKEKHILPINNIISIKLL